MKRVSLRKLSILGIVLLGASAVAAAVIPSKDSAREENCNGRVQNTNGDGPGGKDTATCVAQAEGLRDCFSTAGEGAFSNTENAGPVNDPTTTSACVTQL